MDFFQYKDFQDFINKNGFTIDEGLRILEEELRKREVVSNESTYRVHR